MPTPTSGKKSTGRTSKPQRVGQSVRQLLSADDDGLILTPNLLRLLPMWDGTIDPHVAELMAKLMSTPQRDRSASFSASGSGDCLRKQELMFLGMPATVAGITPGLRQIFMNGTWVHMRWQAMLLTLGLLDGVETKIIKPSLRSRCSMDGIGTAQGGRYDGREFGFELKGRNDWNYNMQLRGPDEKTLRQVDFEFLLSGLELFVIINENKNSQGWKEWVIVRDEARLDVVREEIDELNSAIDTEQLHPMLPECAKQLKKGKFASCPFGGPGGTCISAGNWPN